MANLKIVACKLGKHEWRKVPFQDDQFEMWKCDVCLETKYTLINNGKGTKAPKAPKAPKVAAPAIVTDRVTGLMDHDSAIGSIKSFLSSRKSENYTLCMCGIDNFQYVLDTQGPECGDLVLREATSILKEEIGTNGTPCRFGDDVFLILFPSKNGDEVYDMMFTIRKKIDARVIYFEGDGVGVTMSFGLAEYDFSGDIDAFVAEAEEKMNTAKQMGGDQVVF